MAKQATRRARRHFTPAQKRAIVAEIGPDKTMAAVARSHRMSAPLLAKWRLKLGPAQAAHAPGRPAVAPTANGNGLAKPTTGTPGAQLELEIDALATCLRVITALDVGARDRVLGYINNTIQASSVAALGPFAALNGATVERGGGEAKASR